MCYYYNQCDHHCHQVKFTTLLVKTKDGFRGEWGDKGAMAPKMPNIVQYDTETTQSWCALQ